MNVEIKPEHRWLERLVGEWTTMMEGVGPDGEVVRHPGTESVRSLGGVWVVCEGKMEMPDGASGTNIMTLGYDPERGRFVGSFIGSMMTFMWVYDGHLDGNRLVLDTVGPRFTAEGGMARYTDTIELIDDDHRLLTSHQLGDDGKWTEFMRAEYSRTSFPL